MFWCLQPPGTIFVWILQSIQTRLSHLEVQTCSHKYYYLLLQKRKGRSIFSYQWSRKLQWFFVIINTQEENGIRQKQTFQTRISFTFFVWLFYPRCFWIFLLKSNSSLKWGLITTQSNSKNILFFFLKTNSIFFVPFVFFSSWSTFASRLLKFFLSR